MSDSAPVAQYQCSQCPAKYIRMDHLRRHETKHEGQRLCVCIFCNSEFHRRDILRRHYKTCKLRGEHPIPEPQRRGRRKQACDRCATFKQACNQEQPCQSCVSSNSVCSWDRVQSKDAAMPTVDRAPLNDHAVSVASSPPESSPSEVVAAARESPASTRVGESREFTIGHMSVPFLLNFVNPESRTFVDTFGYSSIAPEPVWKSSWLASLNQRAREFPPERDFNMNDLIPSNSFSGNRSNGMYFEDLNSTGLNGSGQNSILDTTSAHLIFRDFQTGKEPNMQTHSPANSGSRGTESIGHLTMGSDSGSLPDPLKRRLSELVMQLTDIYITLPKGHYACAPNVRIKETDTFFTISNLQMFTETYFHHFHPHCPIIHKPSFDMNTVSLRLILVICLAGALYSSILNRIIMAQSLFDLAEEYIFRNPYLERPSKGRHLEEPIEDWSPHLQALQAALSISFLQNWEGNKVARHRIRMERFGRIVSCAQALNLTSAQNQMFGQLSPESPIPFDWLLFVENETRLRIMYYIFILDRGFCIFHNYHPRIALLEMSAEMPCTEDTFAASSSVECFQSACDEKVLRPPSLNVLLKLFLGESFKTETQTYLKGLTTLHLFILINALHTIIWVARTNFLGSISVDTLFRALSRWETLWDGHRSKIVTRQFKRLGFVRNAFEYWWLARLLVFLISQGVDAGLGGGAYDRLGASFVDDDMTQIRFLLRRYCHRGSSEYDW